MTTTNSPPPEDCRVTNARKTLAGSREATATATEAARWWGALEYTVESLLAVIDEQAGGGK